MRKCALLISSVNTDWLRVNPYAPYLCNYVFVSNSINEAHVRYYITIYRMMIAIVSCLMVRVNAVVSINHVNQVINRLARVIINVNNNDCRFATRLTSGRMLINGLLRDLYGTWHVRCEIHFIIGLEVSCRTIVLYRGRVLA